MAMRGVTKRMAAGLVEGARTMNPSPISPVLVDLAREGKLKDEVSAENKLIDNDDCVDDDKGYCQIVAR